MLQLYIMSQNTEDLSIVFQMEASLKFLKCSRLP